MRSDDKVHIIAEAGVNHNGSVDLALQLVDQAAEIGADAVKFQTFRAANVVSQHAPKADYQTRVTGGESQLEMVRKLELDAKSHDLLRSHCAKRNIQFLSTPFDLESVALLTSLGVPLLKVPSGEITNPLLLRAMAATQLPLIVSTGMSTLGEVEAALAIIAREYLLGQNLDLSPAAAFASHAGQKVLRERVTLLHCTTEYPAPIADVNLRAMVTLGAAFGLPIGYSDHTEGIVVPQAAVALGARVIEKHFTLDRALPGPDHQASLDPAQFKAMVIGIRQVELALGRSLKAPSPSEMGNLVIARRSLVAAKAIRRGEPFTRENLALKRPGSGISPMRYDEWLGQTADRDYAPDELIQQGRP